VVGGSQYYLELPPCVRIPPKILLAFKTSQLLLFFARILEKEKKKERDASPSTARSLWDPANPNPNPIYYLRLFYSYSICAHLLPAHLDPSIEDRPAAIQAALATSPTHLETCVGFHHFCLSQVQLRPLEKSKCFVRILVHRSKD